MQVEVNSYQDIGDYLREVRESLELDVREIGRRLNIRAKYLVALEEGKIDVMPGKVYARGYLQNYAEYLGLNKHEIAEAFDRMTEPSSSKVRYFVPEPTTRAYQPGLLVVGFAVAVALIVYYQWYKTHSVATPLDYEMVSPVPERLLDPIIESPEVQENDDLFVDPMLPPNSTLQGDGNAAVQGETPLPDDAPLPDAQKMDVPEEGVNNVPVEAPANTPVRPKPQSEVAPAPIQQSSTPKKNLPWLQN